MIPTRPEPAGSLRMRFAFAAIVLAAFALRVLDLGGPSLWYDELLELERAELPLWELLRGRGIDQDPPLWSLLLRAWLQAVGATVGDTVGATVGDAVGAWSSVQSSAAASAWSSVQSSALSSDRLGTASTIPPGDFGARLPSVFAGTLAVALLGTWARRLFGRRIGLLAALLAALAPVQVHYSREANQYAALLAWTGAALWTWENVRRRGGRRAWAAHAAVSAAAIATHYGLVFPLLVMGIDLALRTRRRGAGTGGATRGAMADSATSAPLAKRAVAAYAALCAALCGALLALGLASRLDIGHVQKRFGGTHLQKEWEYILDVGWREVLVFNWLPFSGGLSLPIARALSLLALVGAVHLWRRFPTGRRIVGGLLGGLLALTYLTSLFGLYPLGFRHGLFLSPLLLTCLAAGIVVVGEGAARVAAGMGAWVSNRVGTRAETWAIERSGRRAINRRVGPTGSRPIAKHAQPERAIAASVSGLLALTTCAAFVYFAPHQLWPSPWLHVPREEFRPVLGRVAASRAPGDRAWVYHAAGPAFRWYGGAWEANADVAPDERGDATGPEDATGHADAEGRERDVRDTMATAQPAYEQDSAPIIGPAAVLDGRPYDSLDTASVAAEAARIADAAGDGTRVWLLWSHVQAAEHAALLVALDDAGLREIAGTRITARGAMAWAVGRAVGR